MIEFLDESSGNAIGLKASGTLSDVDYRETLFPRLTALFAEHGRLNLLFYMDEAFNGWDLRAAWDDASFGLKHRGDFDKLALVGGPEWVHWCVKLSGFLMQGDIRIFAVDELDQAWTWIKS